MVLIDNSDIVSSIENTRFYTDFLPFIHLAQAWSIYYLELKWTIFDFLWMLLVDICSNCLIDGKWWQQRIVFDMLLMSWRLFWEWQSMYVTMKWKASVYAPIFHWKLCTVNTSFVFSDMVSKDFQWCCHSLSWISVFPSNFDWSSKVLKCTISKKAEKMEYRKEELEK